jgi:hypothetical protein
LSEEIQASENTPKTPAKPDQKVGRRAKRKEIDLCPLSTDEAREVFIMMQIQKVTRDRREEGGYER